MNLSGNDFRRLYSLQDKFLQWWSGMEYPFYLTGGTALGRFYLNHRYSEDLDFFINKNSEYQRYIKELVKKINGSFETDTDISLFTEDFTRIFIKDGEIKLKIEFVNDIEYYAGKVAVYRYGFIDTPVNILSNKLTAITNREEPKDVYDILKIAENFSFRWPEIFYHSKQKALINELDVAERLTTFPVEWIEEVSWLDLKPDRQVTSRKIRQIADDFLFGRDNSVGSKKPPIEEAKPAPQAM